MAITKVNPIAPGSIQEYLDELAAKKICYQFELDQATASLAQADAMAKSRATEKGKIEAYWTRINVTGKLVYSLVCELDEAAKIISKVGINTDYSVQGIDILVRTMRDLSKCWEDLDGHVSDLLKRIDDSLKGENALDNSKSIMKCLHELFGKINDAFPKVEAAIKATIKAFSCAIKLDHMVHLTGDGEIKETVEGCDKGSTDKGATVVGTIQLKGILQKVQDLKSDLKSAGFTVVLDAVKDEDSEGTETENERLAKWVLGEDGYYTTLKKKYEDAEKALKKAEDAYATAKAKKTNIKAKFDSIKTALDAAIEAKDC